MVERTKVILGYTLMAALMAAPASAADPAGVWLTPPDHKGQTAHVVAKKCGAGFCGTITEVFDPQGNKIAGKNVGVRVFWDMKPVAGGYEGRAFVPAYGQEYKGRIVIEGDRMKVSGCAGPICKGQVWRRVR